MTEAPYYRRLLDPDARGLIGVLGGAMFVLLAFVFIRGGPLPALLLLIVAGCGLALKYTSAPVMVVLGVCYLQFFPLGVPAFLETPGPLRGTAFRPTDMLAAVALLVYLAAQYRLYTQLDRAVPDEFARSKRPEPTPPRRPGPVTDGELVRLIGVAGLCVVLGQIGWLLLTNLDLRFDTLPPIAVRRGFGDPSLLSRLGLLVFAGAGWLIVGRTVFGLWRQSRYTADEGRQVLLDVGWQEVRREAARQQTWRAWKYRTRAESGGKASTFGWVFLTLLLGLLIIVGFSIGLWAIYRLDFGF